MNSTMFRTSVTLLNNLVYLTVLAVSTLCNAAYMSRMSTVTRAKSPSVFRPGLSLQRPMYPTRLVASASQRTPYVVYRNSPHRYSMKKITTPVRNVFGNQWQTTARIPPLVPLKQIPSVTSNYDIFRTASAAPVIAADGAIHTIPAPNLSLSQKPIVVMDGQDLAPQTLRPMYEVTEKYSEPPRIEQPIGFSKPPRFSQNKISVRNSAALQLASEYGLPAIQLSEPFMPQKISMQSLMNGINGLPVQQNILPRGPEGIIIPTNSLYQQSDPLFMQKLQNQLAQQFPNIQILPFTSDLQNQQQHAQPYQQSVLHTQQSLIQQNPPPLTQSQPQTLTQQFQQPIMQQIQQPLIHHHTVIHPSPQSLQQPQTFFEPHQSQQHQFLFQPQQQSFTLLQNEQQKLASENLIGEESQKNYVLSAPQDPKETKYVSLTPQAFTVSNVTEKNEETTTAPLNNTTPQLSTFETQFPTTIQYVTETNRNTDPTNKYTETIMEEKTTPIHYAQVEQSMDNADANGIFSAINEIRAAQLLAQISTPQDQVTPKENITTTMSLVTSEKADTSPVQMTERYDSEKTLIEFKNLIATPFEKPVEPAKVAYTLLRSNEKEQKVDEDGSVFAGQLVEASISEDHEFNKEKASLARRAPIKLLGITETNTTTESPNKVTVVKAHFPPKSKITYDDKTGEPVLRIYASYVDSPIQKEIITTKLANMKPAKEPLSRKQDIVETGKSPTIKNFDQPASIDENQVTEFGLKIKSRSDDYYSSLFDDYD